ncbi:MAG: nucleolar RNA-binding Nop10p family protein [Candidatus Helarchaeota archaeon]
MGKLLRKCKVCGRYTINKEICPVSGCGGETIPVGPPKFSLEDRYGKYRRAFKKELGC